MMYLLYVHNVMMRKGRHYFHLTGEKQKSYYIFIMKSVGQRQSERMGKGTGHERERQSHFPSTKMLSV